MNQRLAQNPVACALLALAPACLRAGTPVLALLFLVACTSTPGNDEDAGKVWMRAGSTANVEFAKNNCRASAATSADFKLCMMAAGWKLETPPSP